MPALEEEIKQAQDEGIVVDMSWGPKQILTANGKPFAILAGVDEDSFEDRLAALRRGRAGSALGRIRAKARADGLNGMSMAQIDAVIAKARRARRAAR